MHLSSKKLLFSAYIISIVENFLSAINPPAAIGTGYSKSLSNLVKTYTKNVKYSNYNNNFIFKLAIFHDIRFRVHVVLKAKIKTFFTILKGLALDNFSINIGIISIIMNFNQICYLIKKKYMK